MIELGKIEGRYREMFEAWNSEEKTIAVLGHRKWVEKEKAGSYIGRIDRQGMKFFSPLWRSRKERLAIGDRSCGNNAPSSRGRVVDGLTAMACKTQEYAPPRARGLTPPNASIWPACPKRDLERTTRALWVVFPTYTSGLGCLAF
ncbi:unnamed protein product [Ectocarpus sp. 4 AP-2014]